jgi:hypothetical protein
MDCTIWEDAGKAMRRCLTDLDDDGFVGRGPRRRWGNPPAVHLLAWRRTGDTGPVTRRCRWPIDPRRGGAP